MPNIARHAFKGFFESLGFVLRFNADSGNVFNLANEDDLDPVGIFTIAKCKGIMLTSRFFRGRGGREEEKATPSSRSWLTYISPYASGSVCVESPTRIIFRLGNQE